MLNAESIKLGIAPIGWTNDDLPELGGDISFEQCISEMEKAGFKGCEVGNKFPRETDLLREKLGSRSLSVAGAWISTYFTEDGKFNLTLEAFNEHMIFLKAMGAQIVVVCECGHCVQGLDVPVFDKPYLSETQWDLLCKGLHKIGAMAKKNNMKTAYHHHMGTAIQSLEEVDRLMESTDPELVYLLADTGHMTFAGESPVELVKKHDSRIAHVHLKDIRKDVLEKVIKEEMPFLDAVKKGVFTVPGDGTIDFEPFFHELALSGYRGWFIVEAEQDPNKANPLEYAIKARQFLKNKLGF